MKIRTAALTKAYGFNSRRLSTPAGEELIKRTEPSSRKESSSAFTSKNGLPVTSESGTLSKGAAAKQSTMEERKAKKLVVD